MQTNDGERAEITTLAGGRFWCTEAIFKRLKGVKSVIPGYAGGTLENPSYDEVCTGATGHTESITMKNTKMLHTVTSLSIPKCKNCF
jgi:peptide-methionine (S)-S-oxide reductase